LLVLANLQLRILCGLMKSVAASPMKFVLRTEHLAGDWALNDTYLFKFPINVIFNILIFQYYYVLQTQYHQINLLLWNRILWVEEICPTETVEMFCIRDARVPFTSRPLTMTLQRNQRSGRSYVMVILSIDEPRASWPIDSSPAIEERELVSDAQVESLSKCRRGVNKRWNRNKYEKGISENDFFDLSGYRAVSFFLSEGRIAERLFEVPCDK
jgi:hypothetical protein